MSALELSAAPYSTLPSSPQPSPGLQGLFEAAGQPIPVLGGLRPILPTHYQELFHLSVLPYLLLFSPDLGPHNVLDISWDLHTN